MADKKDYAISFGKEVSRLRLNKGLKQRELAAKSGMSTPYLGSIEIGIKDYPPTREKIEKIAKALDCNLDELLAKAGKVSTEIIDIIISDPVEMTEFIRIIDKSKKQHR